MDATYAGSDMTLVIMILGFVFILFILMLIPTVFYLISMQKALARCAPQNRLMEPGLVWLNLIPFFSLVWQFFTVLYVSGSMDREFRARGFDVEPEPGKAVGLAMCILNVCCVIPYLGFLPGIAALVCWIIYWIKIADYSRRLADAPVDLNAGV